MNNPTPQKSPSPRFYKIISLAFFAMGVVLVWAGFRSHDKVLWIFAAITILNGCMAALKSLVVKETGKS
jgi:uncharacterized membrane protein YcjF (UPF0283 family)